MHWNHRLIKYTLPDGEVIYAVREVFYEDDGSIMGYVNDPTGVQGASPKEVSRYLTYMRKSLKQPALTPADFGVTEEKAAEDFHNPDLDNLSPPRDDAPDGPVAVVGAVPDRGRAAGVRPDPQTAEVVGTRVAGAGPDPSRVSA